MNYYYYLCGVITQIRTIMEDLYLLSDGAILKQIGEKLKAIRLKQNITQQSLAVSSGVPLSTLRRIENTGSGSVESLLRLMRELGMLEMLHSLTEQEQLSPQAYYELVHGAQKKVRKRAAGQINNTPKIESEW